MIARLPATSVDDGQRFFICREECKYSRTVNSESAGRYSVFVRIIYACETNVALFFQSIKGNLRAFVVFIIFTVIDVRCLMK